MKAHADCRRRKKICEMATTTKRLEKKMQLSAINVQNRKCFCPGTSRDRGVCPGTKGQRDRQNFFVPGQRDNGTSRPLETLVKSIQTTVYNGARTVFDLIRTSIMPLFDFI